MGFEEALFAAALAGGYFVWGLFKPRLGVFVASIATLYGPIRFALDRLRVRDGIGADPRAFGLTPAQYAAVLVTLIGLVLWFYVAKEKSVPAVAAAKIDASESPEASAVSASSPVADAAGDDKAEHKSGPVA
jgi:prolipoprotein diacylglyceryltransferase